VKIIDQTPFLSENGEISTLDQIKVTLKFGADWLQEVNAQKTVMACLGKVLDDSFTLLRNARLAGADISIPLILVGPTGIYVLYVTPLRGMFRAKGDSWGTLEGYIFKPARVNLIVRTANMGRALQTYLERQGYPPTSTPIDAVLLATEPGLHIDSVRPVVRVVMRDALENFAASIAQGHVLFSPKTVRDILRRILNPPSALSEQAKVQAAQGDSAQPFAQEINAFGLDSTQESTLGLTPVGDSAQFPESGAFAKSMVFSQPETAAPRKRLSFSTKQWAFLIGFSVIEIIILIIFAILMISNL